MLLSFIKTVIGPPGSINFLALCCAAGLLLRLGGAARAGRLWLLLVYASYAVAGVPLVANAVAARLSSHPPVDNAALLGPADALIVLHGDNVLGRVREARRVFEAARPGIVLVSGEPAFAELVVAAGIPRQRLLTDHTVTNTRDQIVNAARFVRERHLVRPIVVASRLQMPRVAELLHAERLAVQLAPSAVDDEPPTSGLRLFVPTYRALRVTRDALYEHVAIRYYRRNGWIAGGGPFSRPDTGARRGPAHPNARRQSLRSSAQGNVLRDGAGVPVPPGPVRAPTAAERRRP